jgi:S1-C subfamily serine protease
MNPIYLALSLVSVTIHTSVPQPSILHPFAYGLNTCSGVFVSPNEVLTAGHCVANSRGHQWVKVEEGVSYEADIERLDKIKDLALLKITKPLNHAYTSLGTPAKIASAVYTVNSGEGYDHTYNSGLVNNVIIDEEYNILTIMHNAIILPGASGSGLFNSDAELIGINVAKLKEFSEAVDLQEIRAFLKRR